MQRAQLDWRGVSWLIVLTTVVMFTAEAHLVSFTPIQLKELGLDNTEVGVWTGLLVAITMATTLPFGAFWGVLAERFSRRLILIRTYVIMTISLLLAAWAPDLFWLCVTRALLGFSFGVGGVFMATQAMLTPPPHIGRAIATIQTAMPVATSIGPPLGAMAIPFVGLRGLLLIDAALVVVAGVALWIWLPEPRGGHKPASILGRMGEVVQISWTNPGVRWNLISQFVVRAGLGTIDTYLVVRITQLTNDPATWIGWILGGYGALTTIITWLSGRFSHRSDIVRIYMGGMLLATVVSIGIAFAPWLWLIAIFALLRAIPTALSRPLLFAQLARVVPSSHQTAVFGIFPMMGNVGGLLFPLMAAGVVGYGVWAACMVGALGYLSSFLSAMKLNQVTPPRPDVTPRSESA